MSEKQQYRITASIKGEVEGYEGANLANWFGDSHIFGLRFDTVREAVEFAESEYKGPDSEGVEVEWWVIDA